MRRSIVLGVVALMTPAWTVGGQVINEDAKLLTDDPTFYDFFGHAVAIDGDTAIAGAHGDDDNGNNSGAAYVFVRDENGAWTQQAKLVGDDTVIGDGLGLPLALDGDTAVLGAHNDDDNGMNSGSAYVFVRDEHGVWTQQAKLVPADGAPQDWFGSSVSVSGDTAVIGARGDDDNGPLSGSAYVFSRDEQGVWTQRAKLLPSDGAEMDEFGAAVSVSGDTAVVGSYRDDDDGNESGSAYVFTRNDKGAWTQTAKLTTDDAEAQDQFGRALTIEGDTILAAAASDDDNGGNAGAVYVFTRDDKGAWTEQAKLLASDGGGDNYFGSAVSLDGDAAIVGADSDNDNGVASGSAYVFMRDEDGVWTQRAKLVASDGAVQDFLGKSVAIDGDTAIAGTPGDDDNALGAGSVYVFDLAGGDECRADWDGNGLVNPADVGVFLTDYFLDLLNGTLNADFNDDGVTNALDAGAFLSEYFQTQGACP